VSTGRLFLYEPHQWLARDEATQNVLWERKATDATRPQVVWNETVVVWDFPAAVGLVLSATTGIEERRIEAPPGWAFCAGDILVAWHGGFVCVVDLRSGKVLWRFDTSASEAPISGSPCANQDAVFFGLPGRVVARGLTDGRELWSQALPTLLCSRPTPTRGLCVLGDLVVALLEGEGVVGLSARTGSIVWQYEHGERITDGALYGDRYYVLGAYGQFAVLDVGSGKALGRTDLRRSLPGKLAKVKGDFFPLLVSETHAWIGLGPGYVIAFDKQSSEYAWHRWPKGAGSFQGQTYFASANGRLYYADMSCRLYWLEEENPTDPVLKAQRASLGTGPQATPSKRKARAAEERRSEVAFVIQRIASGKPPGAESGGWDVFECRGEDARFSVAVLSEDRETMASGEGRLWVAASEDRDLLVKAAVKAFGKRKGKSSQVIQGLEQMDVTFLGTAMNEEGDDAGTWTHSKWSGPEGVPEFFVGWSEVEKRGVIREKDAFWRNDLLGLLGSLPVHPWP
jgi:outer membrane protein assembly factor BamB